MSLIKNDIPILEYDTNSNACYYVRAQYEFSFSLEDCDAVYKTIHNGIEVAVLL